MIDTTMTTLFMLPRSLWSEAPPEPRTRLSNNPTLLFSWWCTCFSTVIILTRVCGRKIRSDVLFREDWISLLALVPLFARMACIHVVLIYGTNNIRLTDHRFTPTQLRHHELGSRLVLAARIFYAAYLWTSKLTVSEFLKRITIRIWRRSYERTLQAIRIFLGVTFVIVIIATLSECQPFDHYWQVIPDPGPHCRQGFAQLISMGTCDIITDILLVVFPIPIVLRSGQTWKRKLQLLSLFSLSTIMIAVTATRIPAVIQAAGRQQYRTVWASCEILAATFVSNAVVLGSFVRDKGSKRNKYRSHSVAESADRPSTRRPTIATLHNIDSDEDLFRSMGCRVPEHLRDERDSTPRPAPPATAAPTKYNSGRDRMPDLHELDTEDAAYGTRESDDSLHKPIVLETLPSTPSTTRRVSFFDVGGLLEDGLRSRSTIEPISPGTQAHDFAPVSPSTPRRVSDASVPPPRYRNNSSSGLLGPMLSHPEARRLSSPTEHHDDEDDDESGTSPRTTFRRPPADRSSIRPNQYPAHQSGPDEMDLHDPGGLLGLTS